MHNSLARRAVTRPIRRLARGYAQKRILRSVVRIESSSLADFRNEAFDRQTPAFLDYRQLQPLRASDTWFTAREYGSTALNEQYLTADGSEDPVVPLEYTKRVDGQDEFQQITAPLSFFVQWTNEKLNNPGPGSLYLAQVPISDLPERLQTDLPVPEQITFAGKGDIYGSSIWMGLAPTYTPLHRDPNPNLLVQLAGEKIVRLFEPQLGDELFAKFHRESGSMASAKIRGAEMMTGTQEEALREIVWGRGGDSVQHSPFEAVIRPGQAIFIPLGWWHSVQGTGNGVTASANWWFR
jgi:hypothetical protein